MEDNQIWRLGGEKCINSVYSVFHHVYQHSGPLNARLRNSRLLLVQTSYRRVPLSIVLAVLMSYKSPYAKESLLG